jgi:hypothetical protein
MKYLKKYKIFENGLSPHEEEQLENELNILCENELAFLLDNKFEFDVVCNYEYPVIEIIKGYEFFNWDEIRYNIDTFLRLLDEKYIIFWIASYNRYSGTTIHDINNLFKENLNIENMEMFSISIKNKKNIK